MTYEFAIQKNTLNSGKEIFIPLVRVKRKYLENSWARISCIYGVYIAMDLDFDPGLTREQCAEHIINYQNCLSRLRANDIKLTEIEPFES